MKLLIDGKIKTTLAEFLEVNDGLHPDEIRDMENLTPGESVTLGGGGFATFTVERIAS